MVDSFVAMAQEAYIVEWVAGESSGWSISLGIFADQFAGCRSMSGDSLVRSFDHI